MFLPLAERWSHRDDEDVLCVAHLLMDVVGRLDMQVNHFSVV